MKFGTVLACALLLTSCSHGPYVPLNATTCDTSVTATVYGAEWCYPCHQAVMFFEDKDVCVINKNIELDQGAREEMKSKLNSANLSSGTIPVIEVGGELIVGFSNETASDLLERHHGHNH
jgi:glutaredoxin